MWWNVLCIYVYIIKICWFFSKKWEYNDKILHFYFLHFDKKKLHNKIIMHKSHNIILLSQYHSFMMLTSHRSLQLHEPKNESHVRKWVQQQWCNVQEQYNGWKQQGNDYEMKERKNFKCSCELLSCFKRFMNCLLFFKKERNGGNHSLLFLLVLSF